MSSSLLKSHLRRKFFENINNTIQANDEFMRKRLAQRNIQSVTKWQRLDNELRLAEEQWEHRMTLATLTAIRQRYQQLRIKAVAAETAAKPSAGYWAARLFRVGKITRWRGRSMLARC